MIASAEIVDWRQHTPEKPGTTRGVASGICFFADGGFSNRDQYGANILGQRANADNANAYTTADRRFTPEQVRLMNEQDVLPLGNKVFRRDDATGSFVCMTGCATHLIEERIVIQSDGTVLQKMVHGEDGRIQNKLWDRNGEQLVINRGNITAETASHMAGINFYEGDVGANGERRANRRTYVFYYSDGDDTRAIRYDLKANVTTNQLGGQIDWQAYNTLAQVQNASGNLWRSMTLAASADNVSDAGGIARIHINAVNYGNLNGNCASHCQGRALDVGGVTTTNGTFVSYRREYNATTNQFNDYDQPAVLQQLEASFRQQRYAGFTIGPWQGYGWIFAGGGERNLIDTIPAMGANPGARRANAIAIATQSIQNNPSLTQAQKAAQIFQITRRINYSYDHWHHGHFSIYRR